MKNKKLTVGILGTGEVGSSIMQLVAKKHDIFLKDLNQDTLIEKKIDILHVCIPYSNDFELIVIAQIKKNNPQLVIIESTLHFGTTEKIEAQTNVLVVHSPVRGYHKQMVSDLSTFVKFIGSSNKKASNLARQYYKTIGIKTKILSSSKETELGKLLDTTYYALCIAWHQEMERFCKKYGVNFEEAVTAFNITYNQGYKKTKPNVVRPVLFSGEIGGHCLLPNIDLLKKSFNSKFLDIITYSNDLKKKEDNT